MKVRNLFKCLLPITALMLSGCVLTDFIEGLFPSNENKKQEEKEAISVTSALRLEINESSNVNVTPKSKTTELKTVKYVIEDSSVATLSENRVTAKAVGQTTVKVTATTKKGTTLKGACQVVVSERGKKALNYTYDDYNANNIYDFDNCPLEGSPKLLIIPVWFDDSNEFIANSKKEAVRDDIRKTILGSNKETGWRSVKSFYEEESHGKLKLNGTLADWYETSKGYEYYMNCSGEILDNMRSAAVNKYFTTHTSENRKDYDTNGDGYLDAVIFIYAAPDYQNLGFTEMNNFWAYCTWTLSAPNKSNPVMNVHFWGSYDFMYSYGFYAEERTGMSAYGRGDTDHCVVDSHCFIHEFGHILGAPDYYDYSGQQSPAGGFTMQDNNVGGHDPYSVLAYGWAKAYIPTDTTTFKINDFQSSHDVILLANHEVNSPFDEYLLLDLYSPTGLNKFDADNQYNGYYPQGADDYGIRLWHVDARLIYYYFDNNTGWQIRDGFLTDPTFRDPNYYYGGVYHAMTNSYWDASRENYGEISPLGPDYADYNNLELIRSDHSSDNFAFDNMFLEGMSFNASSYSSQFVNGTNMNDGSQLGWSFIVDEVTEGTATITVTKL